MLYYKVQIISNLVTKSILLKLISDLLYTGSLSNILSHFAYFFQKFITVFIETMGNVYKMFVFGVFLVHIFSHLDWIRRDTPYLSVFSPITGKCGSEKLRIRTLFREWVLSSFDYYLGQNAVFFNSWIKSFI